MGKVRNFFSKLFAGERGQKIAEAQGVRGFEAARISRLTNDWLTGQTSLDYDLRWELKTLINRSRHLAKNGAMGEGYLKLLERNVIGASPFQLQSKIYEADGETRDVMAETMIENAWREQCSQANWTPRGNMSVEDHLAVALRSLVCDGGHLVREHKGPQFGKYGYQVEPLDIDYLDPDYNRELRDGTYIKMSIEFDAMHRPIAYHLLGDHPGEYYWMSGIKRTRVLARDIIHVFLWKRSQQSRGFPEFATVALDHRNLEQYKQSELVRNRVNAARMHFLKRTPGENAQYQGAPVEGGAGGKYMDVEPGTVEELPPGMEPVIDPGAGPNSTYPDYTASIKRDEAFALGVSYMSFANDPGDASFSSARIGLVDEREGFKMWQGVIIRKLLTPIFENWLFSALALRRIGNLPFAKFEKFKAHHFAPRSWDWLDPKADAEATAIAEDRGWISSSQIIAERGRDEPSVLEEIRRSLPDRMALGVVAKPRIEAAQAGAAASAAEKGQAKAPLAASLGVGGTQSLTLFLQQISQPGSTMSDEAVMTMLTDVFGMEEAAARKVAKRKPPAQPEAPPAPPA